MLISHVCFTSSDVFLLILRKSVLFWSFSLILLQIRLISSVWSSLRSRDLACVCNWFRWIFMKAIWISIFRTFTNVALYASLITRKHLFCITDILLTKSLKTILRSNEVSHREVINYNRSNDDEVHLFSLRERDASCENRYFRKSERLFCLFILYFSDVWFTFQFDVSL